MHSTTMSHTLANTANITRAASDAGTVTAFFTGVAASVRPREQRRYRRSLPLPARAKRGLWEGTPRAAPARKRAQAPKGPSTRARARARRGWATDLHLSLLKSTASVADPGKPEPARLKFQQAWSVFKSPAVLYNLARAEQLTGHELEALEHFRLFLRVGATDVKITDAMREKAKQNAAELARKVGQVEIEVPASARVTVDGKPLEETPKDPVPVAPGRHTIEATFDGKVRNVSVECVAGSVVKARIEFDTPSAVMEPPAEERESPSAARWIVPTVLGVAGLAGIGVGIGFASKSQSSKTNSEGIRRANPGLCTDPPLQSCDSYKSARDDSKSAATISYVGYIAGGALLAGAVATFVLWPKSKERMASAPSRGIKADTVTPLFGAGTMGAGLQGHF
jgi:hypothetical protein